MIDVLPASVKIGLESLSRLCSDLEYLLESLDLEVGRARVECERARMDEALLGFRPRTAVAWDLQSRVYSYYNEIRGMFFDRNALYAMSAVRVLGILLEGGSPTERHLIAIVEGLKEHNLLDDPRGLYGALPGLTTGDAEIDEVLAGSHRAVTRALTAAHDEDLLWSQAHLRLIDLVDDPGDLDPPVTPTEPGINVALRAYAQGCHGVVLGFGQERLRKAGSTSS